MTGATHAEPVVPCANILGESATWSVREQALYWVDIRAPALHRFEPATGRHQHWPMPELCAAVALASHGVVLAWRQSLMHFDTLREESTLLVEIESPSQENRLNEAKVDRAGRLWVGSMRDFGVAVSGSLYVVSDTLSVDRVLTDIRIPNSLGWSPDNRTMYFADTGNGALCAYSYDLKRGNASGMRTLVADGALPGRPDGCAVDSEGFLWNARYGASCVARISPDGRMDAIVSVPASQPTSCALGGPDLRTLYITTASQRLSDTERSKQPEAGHVFAVRIPVAGLPDTEFDPLLRAPAWRQ